MVAISMARRVLSIAQKMADRFACGMREREKSAMKSKTFGLSMGKKANAFD